MAQPYHVELEIFEGPLDLLLHLIRKHEIDIYDIPIVDITKEYNAYLSRMEELNLGVAGEFLLMASTLVHIKSRTLLPREELDGDEEEDPRAVLVQQLIEHQIFKALAESFHDLETLQSASFPRGDAYAREILDDSDVYVEASVYDLIASYTKLCDRYQVRQPLEFSRLPVSVGDQVAFILEEINLFRSITLDDLYAQAADKIVWVVTFLALLELIRLGYIKAYQGTTFGTIRLIRLFDTMESQAIRLIARKFRND